MAFTSGHIDLITKSKSRPKTSAINIGRKTFSRQENRKKVFWITESKMPYFEPFYLLPIGEDLPSVFHVVQHYTSRHVGEYLKRFTLVHIRSRGYKIVNGPIKGFEKNNYFLRSCFLPLCFKPFPCLVDFHQALWKVLGK